MRFGGVQSENFAKYIFRVSVESYDGILYSIDFTCSEKLLSEFLVDFIFCSSV